MDTTIGDGGPGAARRPGGPSWTSHDGDAECWLATCVDLAGPDDPSDSRRRADATGTATVGGVRVLAVARSVRASSALAGGEAERAVAVALDAADRMLTATSFDVEAAAAAIPRGILNRWRSAAPEEAPGPAHGTSLLVALAGRRGVRVLRFGAGSAAVVHASGVEFLPYVPPLVAEPLDTSIWGAAGPGGAGETVHGENALADEADEGSVLPLPLLGLDHADAVRTVATARVSSTHHPTLLVLSVEPEDGLVEAAREPWAEALRAVDARLAHEGAGSLAEDDAGSGPVTDTHPNSPHRELHPDDHADMGETAVDSAAFTPPPTWLVPALPVTMGTGALAWLPADERAAVAAAPVATAAASTGPARDSGSLARWLVAGLLTLLLAGVASLAWALLTPRAETQLPTAPSTAPLSGTPTTATSAPPPASTATATPSASTSAPPSTSASAVRTTSTPTRRPTRTAAPAPTTAAPTETPAPSTSSPAPSTAEPSSTQPTATATTASPTTPSATSTETVVP